MCRAAIIFHDASQPACFFTSTRPLTSSGSHRASTQERALPSRRAVSPASGASYLPGHPARGQSAQAGPHRGARRGTPATAHDASGTRACWRSSSGTGRRRCRCWCQRRRCGCSCCSRSSWESTLPSCTVWTWRTGASMSSPPLLSLFPLRLLRSSLSLML